MKKIIISFLVILLFGILISNNSDIDNKKYINYDTNTFVLIPYFNKGDINDYLNGYINKFNYDYDYLFIDYDLIDNTNLTVYIYEAKDNIAKDISKSFIINNNNKNIDFNFLNSKIVDKNKTIALTFDDGPNHNTIKVLNILEKYDVKATFFVLGTNITGNEKIIKRMDDLGMEIGNHMYSHSISTRLSNDKILDEINKTDKLVYDITLKYPSLIRPSYGIYNKKFQKIIDRPIVLWNIDTLDWKFHDSKRIANNVFNNINRGNIVLMHDIYNATANSLEIIIPKLLENGFEFVTVSELLALNNN